MRQNSFQNVSNHLFVGRMKFFSPPFLVVILPLIAVSANATSSPSRMPFSPTESHSPPPPPDSRTIHDAKGTLEALCCAITAVKNAPSDSQMNSANLYDQLKSSLFEMHNKLADVRYSAACKLKNIENAIQILDGLALESSSSSNTTANEQSPSSSGGFSDGFPVSQDSSSAAPPAFSQQIWNEFFSEASEGNTPLNLGEPLMVEYPSSGGESGENAMKLPEYRQRNFLSPSSSVVSEDANTTMPIQHPKKTFRIKKLVRVHRAKANQ